MGPITPPAATASTDPSGNRCWKGIRGPTAAAARSSRATIASAAARMPASRRDSRMARTSAATRSSNDRATSPAASSRSSSSVRTARSSGVSSGGRSAVSTPSACACRAISLHHGRRQLAVPPETCGPPRPAHPSAASSRAGPRPAPRRAVSRGSGAAGRGCRAGEGPRRGVAGRRQGPGNETGEIPHIAHGRTQPGCHADQRQTEQANGPAPRGPADRRRQFRKRRLPEPHRRERQIGCLADRLGRRVRRTPS